MAIIDLISSDVIKVPVKSVTKTEIIRELVDVLDKAGKINDKDSVYNAVIARENMGSTGLEKGIAVPHAKTDKVKSLTMAIGIAPEGVDFDSLDGEPSKLFFSCLLSLTSQVRILKLLLKLQELQDLQVSADSYLLQKAQKKWLSFYRRLEENSC